MHPKIGHASKLVISMTEMSGPTSLGLISHFAAMEELERDNQFEHKGREKKKKRNSFALFCLEIALKVNIEE
jgi:hypothetical protein